MLLKILRNIRLSFKLVQGDVIVGRIDMEVIQTEVAIVDDNMAVFKSFVLKDGLKLIQSSVVHDGLRPLSDWLWEKLCQIYFPTLTFLSCKR